MADRSPIEWTDATWNPVRGCTRVSEGCRRCYAEGIAARFSGAGQAFAGFADRDRAGSKWTGRVELVPDMLPLPLTWQEPRRVFVNSMSDLFHEALHDDDIDAVFGIMALAPQHTFQVLTKRPARMLAWLARHKTPTECVAGAYLAHLDLARRWPLDMHRAIRVGEAGWPLPNVHLGISAEDQSSADARIPLLLAAPAARRIVSLEPLLGPINLRRVVVKASDAPETGKPPVSIDALGGWHGGAGDPARIDWVIVGGESGTGARPMDLEWARSLHRQCAQASVPFFMKQVGGARKAAMPPIPEDIAIREFPA